MSKHTPGPWTVDGPPRNQIVWSSAENRVCFLSHSNGLDDERDIANGLLIAAAPDLLLAVKSLLSQANTTHREDWDAAVEQDRSAIDKAEVSP